jgi:flagellar biosynthesis component FlhA
MEFTLAVLMALGIFVGVPVALVSAIGGVYAFGGRLVERAKRVEAAGAEAETTEATVEA